MKRLAIPTCAVLLIGLVAINLPADPDKPTADEAFDLPALAGQWQGEGEFVVPMTTVTVEIEGEGDFAYDAPRQRLRTALHGTKFLVNYSDSGYLYYNPATDSIRWEVWDSWGKHAIYLGKYKDSLLHAVYPRGGKRYDVTVRFPHADSLRVKLTATGADSVSTDQASFVLWRVKE